MQHVAGIYLRPDTLLFPILPDHNTFKPVTRSEPPVEDSTHNESARAIIKLDYTADTPSILLDVFDRMMLAESGKLRWLKARGETTRLEAYSECGGVFLIPEGSLKDICTDAENTKYLLVALSERITFSVKMNLMTDYDLRQVPEGGRVLVFNPNNREFRTRTMVDIYLQLQRNRCNWFTVRADVKSYALDTMQKYCTQVPCILVRCASGFIIKSLQ